MKKVLKHFKNNAIIYLVLLACIIVISIVLFFKPKDELEPVDTSMFSVIGVDQAIRLFNDSDTKLLIISTTNCQATAKYAGYVKYSMVTNGYKPYFLNLDDVDMKNKDKDKIEELGKLIDTDYTYGDRTAQLIEFVKHGYTPITVLIKNKKVIYAFIGSMSTSTLDSLAQAYGLGENNA